MDESIDLDGDGLADIELTGADPNGDGVPDVIGAQVDLNQDGVADVVAGAADLDSDGVPDGGAIAVDTDGDGVADIFAASDGADSVWSGVDPDPSPGPEFSDPYDLLSATHTDVTFPGAEAYYEVHGTPTADMQLWEKQDSDYSCAVATTNMMLRSVGIDDFTEADLANIFQAEGIYDPTRGTDISLIDDVINEGARACGWDVRAVEVIGFDVDQLQEMLDNGIRLEVGVDSSELYGDPGLTFNELFNRPDAGHAVQVTGIDRLPEGDFIRINDPGFADGAGQSIPIEQFMDAAEDCGFRAVAVMRGSQAAATEAAAAMPWLAPALVGAGLLGVAALSGRRSEEKSGT